MSTRYIEVVKPEDYKTTNSAIHTSVGVVLLLCYYKLDATRDAAICWLLLTKMISHWILFAWPFVKEWLIMYFMVSMLILQD